MKHLNWDNLRYVLMVANQGSLSAAARELGVNRSTVLRRIERFQEDLNCRIFNRSLEGYALTPEAEKMIEAAREVESTLFSLQRQLVGRELRLEGEIRVTTTDTFMVSLLARPLASFRQRYPYISVDLRITNQILDLTHRDADVAIRPMQQPEPGFVGRKIRDVHFQVYAATDYLAKTNPQKRGDFDWIGLTGMLHKSPVGTLLEQYIDTARIAIRCDSLVAARSCTEAGMGLCFLPDVLVEDAVGIEPVTWAKDGLTTELWLLTLPDIARSARVSAFIEHMSHELSA